MSDDEDPKKKLEKEKEKEKEKYIYNNDNDINNNKTIPWNTIIQSVPVNSFNYIQSNNNNNNNINNYPKLNKNYSYIDMKRNIRNHNNNNNINNNNNNNDNEDQNNNDINNNNHINDLDLSNNYDNNDNENDINTSEDKNRNRNINRKYHRKKKEINNLKEQIGRVKDQINNLMINSNNPDFNISNSFLSNQPKTTINIETNTTPNLRKNNNTNNNDNNNIDIKAKTYALMNNNNNSNKKNNISNNNNNNNIDIKAKTYAFMNSNNNNDILNKKIEELQKALTKERNKNANLEKEILSLNQYLEGINNEIAQQQQQSRKSEPIAINNIFSPNFFIKIFYNINPKIFSSSELKKYYKIYNTQNINTIFEIFGKTCECLKRQIYESHFEIDTVNTDIDDNCINSRNVAVDSSYRLVNERILKLKKMEFDFINLSEFVKNYLVSQEILVKIIFTTDDNVIQFEPIERLFKLFEDCLNFKIDEMNDNIIFHRKLLIRMLKNQKNCLGLSLESMAQQ